MSNPSPELVDMEKGSLQVGRLEDDAYKKNDREGSIQSPIPSKNLGEKIVIYTKNFERQLVAYNFEARGIQRVEPHETHGLTRKDYMQAFILWISINLAAVNITLGMLGPAVFALSFKDATLCASFGSLLGSIPVAYISTWGPVSGNRTMIFARYTMGWWPSKLVVLLNLIVLLGYALINCVVAGQILSAISSNGSMSIVVGIIIVAVITWAVTTFGIQIFHYYERYAFLPQLIAMSILYGVAAPTFDLTTPSAGDPATITGNRLSFFSLALSAAITYAGCAADFFVYYPPTTPPLPLFSLILTALTLSFTFALTLGIGLASGLASSPPLQSAYTTSQGSLLVASLTLPLGKFGSFLAVIIALGVIANTIPPTYSSGVDFQILGATAEKIPRFVWNTIGVVIYTVCALAGRNNLSEIFTNFLALMGYWLAIWIAITVEEHLLFRRPRRRRASGGDSGGGSGGGSGSYDWTAWNRQERLPVGIAALVAFGVGWAGAVLCMAQVWYVGPIARLVGEYGADMGNYVGFCWAGLVYPPLRWWELRRFGR
ncbi:hypothetical protein MMC12_006329 [Toensbergia leucococca]|nr:hypothetical protein [Toensbergia leucococca]